MIFGVDVIGELEATPEEVRLLELIQGVVNGFNRLIMAVPGSRYQYEKTPHLMQVTEYLGSWLGSGLASDRDVRPDVVASLVAVYCQHYAVGRALWPLASAPEIPESMRSRLLAGYAANEAARLG